MKNRKGNSIFAFLFICFAFGRSHREWMNTVNDYGYRDFLKLSLLFFFLHYPCAVYKHFRQWSEVWSVRDSMLRMETRDYFFSSLYSCLLCFSFNLFQFNVVTTLCGVSFQFFDFCYHFAWTVSCLKLFHVTCFFQHFNVKECFSTTITSVSINQA